MCTGTLQIRAHGGDLILNCQSHWPVFGCAFGCTKEASTSWSHCHASCMQVWRSFCTCGWGPYIDLRQSLLSERSTRYGIFFKTVSIFNSIQVLLLFFLCFLLSVGLLACLQEKLMVNTLQFNLSVPTPYVFMKRFLKAAQSDKKVLLNKSVLQFTNIYLCHYITSLRNYANCVIFYFSWTWTSWRCYPSS